MSRIVVIGGSGHVGTYLIPKLVDLGHEVINVSRGAAKPYRPHFAWSLIQNIVMDRRVEEEAGQFGNKIAALNPDIVVDMISFDLRSTQQIVEALRDKVEQYLFCSTIWVYGRMCAVPSRETDPVSPIDDYGRGKAESEAWLLREARVHGFPATCFRPGHIVGEGWVPTSPVGNSEPGVYSAIARGEELVLPNLGSETLHHVHADDVARWIICAIQNRAASIGEVFNVVSEQAITLRGYAEAVYGWFGKQPRLSYKPFDDWLADFGDLSDGPRGHVVRSSSHSIEKSRARLGFVPRYGSLEAIRESVRALVADGTVGAPEMKKD